MSLAFGHIGNAKLAAHLSDSAQDIQEMVMTAVQNEDLKISNGLDESECVLHIYNIFQ